MPLVRLFHRISGLESETGGAAVRVCESFDSLIFSADTPESHPPWVGESCSNARSHRGRDR